MDKESLSQSLADIKDKANEYFHSTSKVCVEEDESGFIPTRLSVDTYWDMLDDDLKNISISIQKDIFKIVSEIIPRLKSSPLLNEADERDIGICAKKIRAALRLRKFQSWDIEVLHDEGQVLGVNPPGQSETEANTPIQSERAFKESMSQLESMVELIEITPTNIPDGLPDKNPNLPRSYRPNTAFIMMRINPDNPELDDVYDTYKQCFESFGIKAIRADDIEHEEVITSKIIEEIKTSEFLLGDLTDERPSVYYEIGYAHSLGRRVIMYRKSGTNIHFDLAAYNCPEYENMRELKNLLTKRLEQATNKKPKNG